LGVAPLARGRGPSRRDPTPVAGDRWRRLPRAGSLQRERLTTDVETLRPPR